MPTLRQQIARHLESFIGPVAKPEQIYFVSSLPKTRSGKIMRRMLKAVAQGQEIGDTSIPEDESSLDEVRNAYERLKEELVKGDDAQIL